MKQQGGILQLSHYQYYIQRTSLQCATNKETFRIIKVLSRRSNEPEFKHYLDDFVESLLLPSHFLTHLEMPTQQQVMFVQSAEFCNVILLGYIFFISVFNSNNTSLCVQICFCSLVQPRDSVRARPF